MEAGTRHVIASPARAARSILLVALTALSLGCTATTDQDIYEIDEEAWGIFTNHLPGMTVYLSGCGFFTKEKLVGDKWIDQGSDIVCVWEGFAFPVAPKESAGQLFLTDEEGTWRLVYDFGLFCSDDEPMNELNCRSVGRLKSNVYQVVAPEEPEPQELCEQTGGLWNLASCGHWFCGQPPLCLALIPGCNCGTEQIFDPGVGCIDHQICQQVPPCSLDTAGNYTCPLD